MLERVFELFRQVGSGADRAHGGLGIGLTIVRQLVELHGGSVEARSDGPGKGSEFVIRLPLARHAAANGTPRAARPLPRVRRRILVVDDNRDAARALATMLELEGHDVRLAFDGKQALELAEQHRPEAILMDLGMPNMNGYEAARRLRRAEWGRAALLVAVTGWGQQADRAASERSGFDHHLVKPVDPAAVQCLVTTLDRR
jgi:CheY-like chemotaxis protein